MEYGGGGIHEGPGGWGGKRGRERKGCTKEEDRRCRQIMKKKSRHKECYD